MPLPPEPDTSEGYSKQELARVERRPQDSGKRFLAGADDFHLMTKFPQNAPDNRLIDLVILGDQDAQGPPWSRPRGRFRFDFRTLFRRGGRYGFRQPQDRGGSLALLALQRQRAAMQFSQRPAD